MREVDDPSADEWTAVDDPHLHRFLIGQIRDPHPGSERKRSMSGSEFLHVVDLAVRGGAPVIRMAVPTGHSRVAGMEVRSGWKRACCMMLLPAIGQQKGRETQRAHACEAARAMQHHARS